MPDLKVKVPGIEVRVSGVKKLLDYTASGVGAVAGPMLAKWRASQEGKARLTSARLDAEARLIEAESEARTSVIIAKARAEAREYLAAPDADVSVAAEFTRDDIIQRIEFQERKRLANISTVVEDAANELGDKEVSDHESDPDWTARFFNDVQDVSSEDMQNIWARILAGEVESPGRTSLRTLDTLRNMTKTDAEMFRDICHFVIGGDYVFYRDGGNSIDSLSYDNLIHLQDCGLVNVGPNLVRKYNWDGNTQLIQFHHNGALEINRTESTGEQLEIPIVLLTTAGRELAQYVQGKPNMEYLQDFSGFLKAKNHQLSYLDSVSPLPGGRIRFSSRTCIEPKD